MQVAHHSLPSREGSYSSDPVSNLTVRLILFNTLKHHMDALTCHNWAINFEENLSERQHWCLIQHISQRKKKQLR